MTMTQPYYVRFRCFASGHQKEQVVTACSGILRKPPQTVGELFAKEGRSIAKFQEKERADIFAARLRKVGVVTYIATTKLDAEPAIFKARSAGEKSRINAVPTSSGYMVCQKCGVYQKKASVCNSCGIVIVKYQSEALEEDFELRPGGGPESLSPVDHLFRGVGWTIRKSPFIGVLLLGYLYFPEIGVDTGVGSQEKTPLVVSMERDDFQITAARIAEQGAAGPAAEDVVYEGQNPYAQRLRELGVKVKLPGDGVIYPEDLKDLDGLDAREMIKTITDRNK